MKSYLLKLINRYKNSRIYKSKDIFCVKSFIYGFTHILDFLLIKPCDILYFYGDANRYIKLNEHYFCPYIQPIINSLQHHKSTTLAMPFTNKRKGQCADRFINLNILVSIAIILRFLKTRSFYLQVEEDSLTYLYSYILNKTKAKLIIGITPPPELCLAAKKNNCKTIDIQHGVINFNLTNSYYSLDKREKINQKGWPDYIAFQMFKSYMLSQEHKLFIKTIYVGNVEAQFNNCPEDNAIQTIQSVFYTAQPMLDNYDEDHIATYKNVKLPKRLVAILNQLKLDLTIKLHPRELKNRKQSLNYSILLEKMGYRHKVNFMDNCSLESLWKHIKIHLSFNSASCLRSLANNVPTVVLDYDEDRCKKMFPGITHSNMICISKDDNIVTNYISSHLVINSQKFNPSTNLNDEQNFDKFIQKCEQLLISPL